MTSFCCRPTCATFTCPSGYIAKAGVSHSHPAGLGRCCQVTDNSCSYAHDGKCDDQNGSCPSGTDCSDCGNCLVCADNCQSCLYSGLHQCDTCNAGSEKIYVNNAFEKCRPFVIYNITSDRERYWNVGEIQLLSAGVRVPIEAHTCRASSKSGQDGCWQAFDDVLTTYWSPDYDTEPSPYWIQFRASPAADAIQMYQTGHGHSSCTLKRSADGGSTWTETAWSLNRAMETWSDLSITASDGDLA